MSWSNEWPKSPTPPVWPVDPEWQEHIDINGGINPVALGWRANDIGDPIINC